MRTTMKIALGAAALGLALSVTACGPAFVRVDLPKERAQEQTATIDAKGAREARVQLQMGVGELRVSGGASQLMDARFDYRPADWKPEVVDSTEGSTAVVVVRQPSHSGLNVGRARNAWDVKLKDGMPLDLDVVLGVGKADLRLGSLSLRDLGVRGGAGETTIDLSGTPSRDLIANVQSGVGEVKLVVPREAGVRITGIHDGVGDWQAEGFTKRAGDDDAVYNAAYDTAKYRYVINMTRGVGDIRVRER